MDVNQTIGRSFLLDPFTLLERRALLWGSFCIPVVLCLIHLISLHGFVNHDKYLLVVFLTLIVPVFSFVILRPSRRTSWLLNSRNELGFLILNLGFILLVSIWFGKEVLHIGLPAFNLQLVVVSYIASLSVFLAAAYWRWTASYPSAEKWSFLLLKVLLVAAPLLAAIVTIAPMNWYLTRPFDASAALWGSIVAIITLILWRLHSSADPTKSRRLLTITVNMLVFAAPFLMMDVDLTYDALHYTAYLGAAAAVKAGRIPLIDVFCQYGQSYLLYNLGWIFLPATYHAAGLVTALANASLFLCFLIILRKLMTSDVAFLLTGTTLPFLLLMTYHYNDNATPSQGGMRYLPVAILSAILIWTGDRKRFSIASSLSVMLCWCWSFECAAYASVLYGFYLVGKAGPDGTGVRQSGAQLAADLGRLLGLLSLTVFIIVGGYYIAFGKVPRYDLYLTMVMSYIGTDPFMDYFWFEKDFYVWLFPLTAYFILNIEVARCFFVPGQCNSISCGRKAIIAALGFSIGTYCILSTQPFIFKTILAPFFILLYWAEDAAVGVRGRRIFSPSELVLAPLIVLFSGLLAGAAVANFSSPLVYGANNSVMLRYLISEGRLGPERFVARLHEVCPPSGVTEVGNVCLPGPQNLPTNNVEFRTLIDRWAADDQTLVTFHPLDTMISVVLAKPHRLPISFAYVDGFSPQLFHFIVERSANIVEHELKPGQIVFAVKDLALLNELEWALLKQLASSWFLEMIDETPNIAVYRLTKDPTHAIGKILSLPDRPIRARNVF